MGDDPFRRRCRCSFKQTVFLKEIIQLASNVGLFHRSLRSQLGQSSFCRHEVSRGRPLGLFLKTVQENHRLPVHCEHHSGDAGADTRPDFPKPRCEFPNEGHPDRPAKLSRFDVLPNGSSFFPHQPA
jgi:hypothetical protein